MTESQPRDVVADKRRGVAVLRRAADGFTEEVSDSRGGVRSRAVRLPGREHGRDISRQWIRPDGRRVPGRSICPDDSAQDHLPRIRPHLPTVFSARGTMKTLRRGIRRFNWPQSPPGGYTNSMRASPTPADVEQRRSRSTRLGIPLQRQLRRGNRLGRPVPPRGPFTRNNVRTFASRHSLEGRTGISSFGQRKAEECESWGRSSTSATCRSIPVRRSSGSRSLPLAACKPSRSSWIETPAARRGLPSSRWVRTRRPRPLSTA